MTKKYAVLPCNGLDKCAGQITREIAQIICEKTESQLICPVFYRVADARYSKIANDNPLIVIDGCATRCASKLAAEKNLKIYRKMNVSDEAPKHGVKLAIEPLRLWEDELILCRTLAAELIKEEDAVESIEAASIYLIPDDYLLHTKDKFIFRIPPEGFFFTENDCWVQPVGNRARIGVTDYVQQSLSDIMFFTPPSAGSEVEQFGEAGAIESGKAVFELVCPVSGKIVAVNQELLNSPEKINENPYVQGWIVELELTNFAEEKEFLLDAGGYLKVLKKKVDDFHVNQRKG
jgi:glycine cleavage system H protein